MKKKGSLMRTALIRRVSRRLLIAGSPASANPAEQLGAAHE
ncbi:MAG: hypothetical protein ACJ8R9_11895 [Steroidobacteraceae bacterium]